MYDVTSVYWRRGWSDFSRLLDQLACKWRDCLLALLMRYRLYRVYHNMIRLRELVSLTFALSVKGLHGVSLSSEQYFNDGPFIIHVIVTAHFVLDLC